MDKLISEYQKIISYLKEELVTSDGCLKSFIEGKIDSCEDFIRILKKYTTKKEERLIDLYIAIFEEVYDNCHLDNYDDFKEVIGYAKEARMKVYTGKIDEYFEKITDGNTN